MIKVILGSNLNKTTVIVPRSTTIRAALEANQVDYARYQVTFDGCPLRPTDLDKTFDAMTQGEKCFLLTVQKMDNAR